MVLAAAMSDMLGTMAAMAITELNDWMMNYMEDGVTNDDYCLYGRADEMYDSDDASRLYVCNLLGPGHGRNIARVYNLVNIDTLLSYDEAWANFMIYLIRS